MKPAAALLLIVLTNTAGAQEQPCLKEVFNRYCLGGPSYFIETGPIPDHRFASGGGEVLVFKGPETTFVSIYDGLIERVMRTYSPSTMLTFGRIRTQLVELYGAPTRNANLPSYATSSSDIETAIAVGRGRVSDTWKQEGWTIMLLWADSKAISLIYTHTELAAKRRKANPNPGGF